MSANVVRVSAQFKAHATKAIFWIAIFILTYLVIVFLAITLTVLCMYGGILLIVSTPSFITVALGIGIASFGLLILIFLVKFIFKSHAIDRSHLHEITRSDAPALFHLIDDIVRQVKTPFPKNVYLTADVNASVFYDSSFLSMFFPVKKNLQIGLGLVNAVNETELKAILSHEFGHFSQRTMKIGSFVYNVNHVIYNMLYDNETYDKAIHKWGNFSAYFLVFVALAIRVIRGIQWLLRKLYSILNTSYMALSREMEFHADEIAASVTGYEPLKSSLLRMAMADYAFNQVLAFYNEKIPDSRISPNIFKEHAFVMNFIAARNNIPVVNNLPDVTIGELNKFNKSKLVVTDQWASHPGIEERIHRLEKTQLRAAHQSGSSGNAVFGNIEQLQEQLTAKMFQGITYPGEISPTPFQTFKSDYENTFLKNAFSTLYNGYYDNHNPLQFDPDRVLPVMDTPHVNALFSDENLDLVLTMSALQNDIEVIKQIADQTVPVKTFDYAGKKYKYNEISGLLFWLQQESEELKERILKEDIRIFAFFRFIEKTLGNSALLTTHYQHFFDFDKAFNDKHQIYVQLSNALRFVNETTPFNEILKNFADLEPLEEKLKGEIRHLMEFHPDPAEMTSEMKTNFELYLSKEWSYFSLNKYLEENLKILFTALNNYAFLLFRTYFTLKKHILDYQEELIKQQAKSHEPSEMKL